MNKTLHGLAAQYTSAMQDYLAMTGGICLESARELGCRALVAKASITDLVTIHQEALLALLCNVSDAGASESTRKRAAEFLTHTLLPYEDRHCQNAPNFPTLRSPSGAGKEAGQSGEVTEFASTILYVTDCAGNLKWWNQALERATGWPRNALKNKRVLEFFNPSDRLQILQKLRDVLVREQVEIETDFLAIAGFLPYRFQVTVMRNASGQAMGLVSTGKPILRPPIATATLQESGELKALKSRIVSTISHEFRTPLTTILSSSELLERYRHQLTEEKQLKHLHKIQAAVQRLTEMLNDVLTLESVEAGTLKFNPAPINLSQFCRELVDCLQLSLPQQRLILTHRGEYTEAWLDENLLRHVLTNLLFNAIKYSPSDSAVELNVVCRESEVTFKVIDRGMGIAPEERMRLFESFYRGNNAGNIQGTGLGLAIAKQCVDLHGGQIGVVSEVGVGTTFTVKFPSRCGWQKLKAIAPQYLPR